MEAVYAFFGLGFLVFSGVLVFLFIRICQMVTAEVVRQQETFQIAMNHLSTRNLKDKVEAEALSKQFELQLNNLQDNLLQESVQDTVTWDETPTPKVVTTVEGKQVNLNEYEPL